MKRTDSFIHGELQRIIASIVPDEARKDKGCEYHTPAGCKATSNKTCKNCKFYSPTMHEKLQMIVGRCLDLEDVEKEQSEYIATLEEDIDCLNKKIEWYKKEVELWKMGYCPDRMRCTPYFGSGDVITISTKRKRKNARRKKAV